MAKLVEQIENLNSKTKKRSYTMISINESI